MDYAKNNYGKYNTGRLVRLTDLSDEEQQRALLDFAEGNKSLHRLLKTALETGYETIHCCAGHENYVFTDGCGMVGFKMTEDKDKSLCEIGRHMSRHGIAAQISFVPNTYPPEKRITFDAKHVPNYLRRTFNNGEWFSILEDYLKVPPQKTVAPNALYYRTEKEDERPDMKLKIDRAADSFKFKINDILAEITESFEKYIKVQQDPADKEKIIQYLNTTFGKVLVPLSERKLKE